MKNMASLHDMAWVCIGDFNDVLRHDGHDGIGTRSQSQIENFRDAVDVCGLLDLGYSGTRWTYEKKVIGGSYTWVRLDRALATADWCELFPLASVQHLTAATSDHSPILLQLEAERIKRTKPFIYEKMWETHADLKDTV